VARILTAIKLNLSIVIGLGFSIIPIGILPISITQVRGFAPIGMLESFHVASQLGWPQKAL
jgi:hypothetical protein